MGQQYPHSDITDGTISCVFQDGAGGDTDHPMQGEGWAPDAPERRIGKLGSQSPYEDAVEQLPVGATGDTPAAALASAGRLKRLLDQADRWSDQEDVDPVTMRIRVQGSTLPAYLKALVLGRKSKDQSPDGSKVLQLPAKYSEQAGLHGYIKNIIATIKHRSPWVLTDDGYDPNYVANSSFESNNAGSTTGWTSTLAPTVTTMNNDVAHGYYSCRIENASTTAYRGLYQDVSGLTPGASYRVSVYVTPLAGTCKLVAYDGGGTSNAVEANSSGTSLQRLELTKVAPAGGSIRIALIAHTAGAVGKFDAALLEALNTTTGVAGTFRMKASEALTQSGSSAANGAVMPVWFADDHPTTSPVKLSLSGLTGTNLRGGYLLVAKQQEWLTLIEGETLASGAPAQYTSVTAPTEVATTLASGGIILRYLPTTTAEVSSGLATLSNPSIGKRLAIFAVVRNNNAAKTYQLSATLETRGSTTIESTTTGRKDIDGAATGTNPQVISLGEIACRSVPTHLKLNITATSTGSSLDIDRLVILTLDDEDTSRAIALGTYDLSAIGSSYSFVVDHKILSGLDPFIGLVTSVGGTEYPLTSAQGDPFLNMVGRNICAVLLLTGGDTATCWRHDDAAAATSHVLTVTRSPAYLIPE